MADHTPNEHSTAGEPQHFSETDWDTFRAEDFAAGKAVVVLMLGIFSGGVVLYSAVAYFIMF